MILNCQFQEKPTEIKAPEQKTFNQNLENEASCFTNDKLLQEKDVDLKILSVYEDKKDLQKQKEILQKIIVYCPLDELLFKYANILLFEKEYIEAVENFKEIKGGNYFVNSLFNLSKIYSMQNDKEHSLKYLEKTLRNGFIEYDKIKKDPDLLWLRKVVNINVWLKNAKLADYNGKSLPGQFIPIGASYSWDIELCRNNIYLEWISIPVFDESYENADYDITYIKGVWSFKDDILYVRDIEICKNKDIKSSKLTCIKEKVDRLISPYAEVTGVFWGFEKVENKKESNDCKLKKKH